MNGEKLKQVRQKNNLTQTQLAAELGVSRITVAVWENTSSLPTSAKLRLLAWAQARANGVPFNARAWLQGKKPRLERAKKPELGTMKASELGLLHAKFVYCGKHYIPHKRWAEMLGLSLREYNKLTKEGDKLLPLHIEKAARSLAAICPPEPVLTPEQVEEERSKLLHHNRMLEAVQEAVRDNAKLNN
jgi:transcriptional regulator with XRE-family HTH domain